MTALALLVATGCEGDSAPMTGAMPPPTNGETPIGNPDVPLPALAGPHACSARLTDLVVYQAVKTPLLTGGGLPVASRNAPVIEGRKAIFRAFLSLGGGAAGNVRGRLRLTSAQGGYVFDDEKRIGQDSTDSGADTTLNFEVPGAAIRGDTQVSLELDVGGSCEGGGASTFPAGAPLPLGAQYTGTLRLTLVPVKYDADGSGRMPDVSEAQLQRYRDALMAVYPAEGIQITVREPVSSSILLSSSSGWGNLLESLRQLRLGDRATPDVYYYAVVSPAVSFQTYCRTSCTAGLSYLVGDSIAASGRQVGAGVGWSGGIAAETLIHEIGHQHGRPHTPCGNGDGKDADFPYSAGEIGVWGLDVFTGAFKPPYNVKDFMGYCSPQWISDYNFGQLANRFTSVFTRSRLLSAGPSTMASKYRTLLVEDDGGARWGGLVHGADSGAGTPEPAQVLDASGAVIAQVTVYRTGYGHGPGASIEVPEAQPGWYAVALAGGRAIRYSSVTSIPALRPVDPASLPAGQPASLPARPGWYPPTTLNRCPPSVGQPTRRRSGGLWKKRSAAVKTDLPFRKKRPS